MWYMLSSHYNTKQVWLKYRRLKYTAGNSWNSSYFTQMLNCKASQQHHYAGIKCYRNEYSLCYCLVCIFETILAWYIQRWFLLRQIWTFVYTSFCFSHSFVLFWQRELEISAWNPNRGTHMLKDQVGLYNEAGDVNCSGDLFGCFFFSFPSNSRQISDSSFAWQTCLMND